MVKIADLSPIDALRYGADHYDPKAFLPIAGPGEPGKACCDRLRSTLQRSHAVIFDTAASEKLGELSVQPPGVLLYLAQSARLPWESVLLQVDMKGFRRGGGTATDNSDPHHVLTLLEAPVRSSLVRASFFAIGSRDNPQALPIVSEPYGALIDTSFDTLPSRDTPFCRRMRPMAAEFADDLLGEIAGAAINVSIPMDAAGILERMLGGRDPLDLIMLGREFIPPLIVSGSPVADASVAAGKTRPVGIDLWRPGDLEARIALGALMSPCRTPYADPDSLPSKFSPDRVIRETLQEAFGAARLSLAAMIVFGISGAQALVDPRPRGARMVGNKRCPYLATWRIVIDLSHPSYQVPARDDEKHEPAFHKRAHHVRGFWRYFRAFGRGGDPLCSHQWETLPVVPSRRGKPVEEDPDRQHCAICDARRTWTEEHQRGDAALGYVTHPTVEVTA